MPDDRPGTPEGDRPEERPASSPTEPLRPPTEPTTPPAPPGAGPAPTTPLPGPPAAGGPSPSPPPPTWPAPTTPVPEPPPPPPGYGQPGYGQPPPGAPPYGGQPGYGPAGYGTQPGYGYGYPAGPPTDSSATAALVIAIVGFFICPPVGAVVALVMANSAQKRIEASQGRLGGLELAKAARIIAIVELALTAFLLVGGILLVAFSLGPQ
jgi:hypothetical protein